MEFNEDLRNRSKKLAIEIIRFYSLLEKRTELFVLGKQLLRSGTSVAANFRAATRGRSSKEYYAKLCIVVEECDETLFWLELLKESNLPIPDKFETIYQETLELLKIFSSARKKMKEQLK